MYGSSGKAKYKHGNFKGGKNVASGKKGSNKKPPVKKKPSVERGAKLRPAQTAMGATSTNAADAALGKLLSRNSA